MLQATCPHWKAVSFFLSMQIEHICASSRACILLSSCEKSDLFTLSDDPVGVSFSFICSLHWMHRFNRMLQSTHASLWRQGENVMVASSSSHSLHLSFFIWALSTFVLFLPELSGTFVLKLKLKIYFSKKWSSFNIRNAKKLTLVPNIAFVGSPSLSGRLHDQSARLGACFWNVDQLRSESNTMRLLDVCSGWTHEAYFAISSMNFVFILADRYFEYYFKKGLEFTISRSLESFKSAMLLLPVCLLPGFAPLLVGSFELSFSFKTKCKHVSPSSSDAFTFASLIKMIIFYSTWILAYKEETFFGK